MTGPDVLSSRRLRGQRIRARLPKLLLLTCVAVLCVAGVRAAVMPQAAGVAVIERGEGRDLAAEAFAEAFARAYLSWEAARPEDHQRRVAAFVSESLDPGAGLVPARRGGEEAVWTAATQSVPGSHGGRLVTVAVQTTSRLAYLAVPVDRDAEGFLFVSGYPALIGGPAVRPRVATPAEAELDDGALRAVVERAVGNYLAREAGNLRADLDPAAVVSLPAEPLRLGSVDEFTHARPGVVACVVSARDPRGIELRLRYELHVVRRDRWYVRSIATDPRKGGS